MRAAAGLRRLLSSSAAASHPRVRVTRGADGVVQVTLARADKLNALDMDMFRQIRDAAQSLIGDTSAKAVVVHGEGRAFCAGLDVKSIMSPLQAMSNQRELLDRPDGAASNLAQDVGYLWRRVPCPVIAAIHGVCFGGGFQIALGADIRIASQRARFSIMEAKWGLIPDMSATVTLPELVPRDVALELTLTGRVFAADEARRLGLVTRLVGDDGAAVATAAAERDDAAAPLEEAMRLARQIASKASPDAAAGAKRLLHAAYTTQAADDARLLGIETELQRRLIGGWNQVASASRGLGAPAFLQPAFRDRAAGWSEEADERAEAELLSMLEGGSAGAAGGAAAEEGGAAAGSGAGSASAAGR